jgi:hypothetical protein
MRKERVIVCAAVVLLHAGLYLVLTSLRLRIEPEESAGVPESLPITLAMMPDAPAPQPGHAVRQRPQAPAGRMRATPAEPGTEAITAPPLPPPTDWAAEAARAADSQVQAQMAREHPRSELAPRGQPLAGSEPRAPAFGWDESATHRIQPAGGGVTLVHINERCGIAFYLVVPFAGACALGKLDARGDLFKHMHDAPKMGDWDDKKKVP